MKQKSFTLGYYQIGAWFTVWAIFTFVNAAGVNVYRNALCDYYGVSAAPLLDGTTYGGWVGGVLFLVLPVLIQKFGAKMVLLTTVILGGIVFGAIPLVNNVIWMQLGILLSGVFAGIYGISTPMILVSRWFPKRKGSIMGIVSSGAILASVAILPAFNYLLKISNVKVAMMAMGGFMITFGILNLFLMKETPAEAGLFPDNDSSGQTDTADRKEILPPQMTYRQVFSEPRFWFISLGWGFLLIALLGMTFIGVSYMIERGLSNDTAVLGVSICGILTFFVSILSGMVDQKYGPVKAAILFFLVEAAGMLIVIFYHGSSVPVIMLGYLLVVGTFGVSSNLASSQNLSAFGVREYPLTYNCQGFANSFIKMLGAFIAARSLEWVGDYSLAYKVFGVSLFVGIICIILGGDTPLKKRKETNYEQTPS